MKSLHFHRRYNWGLFYRNHRRAFGLALAAAMLALALLAWHKYLALEIAKIRAENQTRTVLAAALRPRMGTPIAHGDLEFDATWKDPQPVR